MSRRLVSVLGAVLLAVAVTGGAVASSEAADAQVVAGDGHWCC